MNVVTIFFIAAIFVSTVSCHSYLSNIIVNGQVQSSCVKPHPQSLYNYPMSDITNPSGLQSSLMTCGRGSGNAQSKCPVPAGSTIGFQWHYEMDLSPDTFIIDPSHKGPCLVYMAKSDTGTGPVWFKIFEDGYDSTTQKWCVTRLRENGGVFEARVPSDLAPGNYLIRAELIALHGAYEVGGAQPYVHCAELTISGSGTSNPSNLVSFPGAYQANSAGIYFNIYQQFSSYPLPGPAVYTSSNSAVGSSTSTTGRTSSSSTSTTGRSSSSSSSSTTGRTSSTSTSTTGRAPSSSSSTSTSGRPASASTSTSTGSATSGNQCISTQFGNQRCLSDNSGYQTCSYGQQRGTYEWAAAQRCQAGLSCHQQGDNVYCY